jgi:CRISPR-associated endonuclease/helicase Cas3
MHASDDFDGLFSALCGGRTPFHWQRRLFDEFVQGRVPQICAFPTGLGKTSVIPIWLIALAHSAEANGGRPKLPRRLVYIVDRRTVVDQATDLVEGMRKALSDAKGCDSPAGKLWRTLRGMCATQHDEVLAVSTLRGELADNREWKIDPARPAIIIGTVDMIGSKLLFSGYGDGRYGRAHHAGLIGQDTLIVHDEAHLSPAFSHLLWTVEREQRQAREPRPVCVLELSATSRQDADDASQEREAVWQLRGGGGSSVFGITPEDDGDALVARRRSARKKLGFETCDTGKGALTKAIVAKALAYRDSQARILVYVRSPQDGKEIASALRNGKTGLGPGAENRVGLLTGTIRGHERDQLAKSRLFEAFKARQDRASPERTIYLVCTSAGEVGVDFDADHLICDLTTLDSMAQRFGRVNRLGGEDRCASITVFYNGGGNGLAGKKSADGLAKAVECTGGRLRAVVEAGGDVSPGSLAAVLASPDAGSAFSPTPAFLPATDILFDAWALTSITGVLPGRPQVGAYLHGESVYEPPETYVAWRPEVAELARADVSSEDLEEMLEVFPIRPAERLRDRADRVQAELEAIAARDPEARAILIRDGEASWRKLSELAPVDKRERGRAQRELLAYATVLLPTEVGGLRDGMLDGRCEEPVLDVAEFSVTGQARRQRVRVTETETALSGAEVIAGLVPRLSLVIGREEAADEDAPPGVIEYRVAKGENAEPGAAVPLGDHLSAAEAAARSTAAALKLPSELGEALGLAARWHDRGKWRRCWQRYARNEDLAHPLAKAPRYGDARRELGGYRHEFGSLHDASADGEIAAHPECELILHLIGAHHGWGRPHFRRGLWGSADDAEHTTCENAQARADAMRRLGRLQQRFGRWGLAWLESLLRCADEVASAECDKRGEQ